MGQYGADISTPSSGAQWADMRTQLAVDFGVVRCFEQVNVVDPQCLPSLAAARAAGIADMSVYHFPATSTSATAQTTASINNLVTGKATIGYYWLDVERGSWSSDIAHNVAFIAEWVQAAESLIAQNPQLGCRGVGIYTRKSDWTEITGGITDHGHLPLWWIMILNTPDGPKSFDHFTPFGGWTQATMVQWTIDQRSGAGLGYDGNWRPGVPAAGPAPAPPATGTGSVPDSYTVQPGDTLASVAAEFGTTVADLAHLNNIINPADFKPGRTVRVR